jgi:arylsulfatase A-like enzyme
MATRGLENASSQMTLILGGAILIGLADAVLVAGALLGARGAIQYVPPRIWLVSPLVWSLIACVVALPLYPFARDRTGWATTILLTLFLFAARFPETRLRFKITAGAVSLTCAVAIWKWAKTRNSLPRSALFVTLLVAAAGALFFVNRPRAASAHSMPQPHAPNVIVIFLDTVRYDALFGADGRIRNGLPAFARLAQQSVVFDRAYAPSPWTLPSTLAAVTRLPVEQLGIDFDHQIYDRTDPTLAERFRRRGYRTAAVISNSFLNSGTGFDRGFDTYEHADEALDVCRTAPGSLADEHWPWFAATICNWSASEVSERAIAQLNDRDRPLFLLVNYMDAHDPYYVERDCGGGIGYDAAIRCVDRRIAPIIDWRSPDRATIVAVIGDHGEQFGEHGLVRHGNSLYVQLLHVPFMIRSPNLVPSRVGDAFSTVALASLLDGVAPEKHPVVPATAMLVPPKATKRPREWSAIEGSWHLIVRENHADELYDLVTDPAETRNVIDGARQNAVVQHLHMAIGLMQRAPVPNSSGFRALGYVQ